jgi:dihydrofolate synthase/folylpolyglutamate synthase
VLHVAGTNGKGSTCAFLRAMLEAAGHRVHAYTSPHLVRFNERIRLAGTLIEDDALALVLAEVLDAAEAVGISASFFEITTAAAFLAFARTPADACVIEVGLGGRLDATNVIPAPTVCGIASLGIDHEAFLLAPEAGTPAEPLARIAFEKAGIAKSGVPLVTQHYAPAPAAAVAARARRARAPLYVRDDEWRAATIGDALHYSDAQTALDLPRPGLAGAHQADNAALAVAMLRHQTTLTVPDTALAAGIAAARWPARLQHLGPGPLTDLARGRPVWLDGGHNPDAGSRIAAAFASHAGRLDLILGMLANKDPAAILRPLLDTLGDRLASVAIVPVPGHQWHDAAAFSAVAPPGLAVTAAPNLQAAVAATRHPILIGGSLYLAGEALHLNQELPV